MRKSLLGRIRHALPVGNFSHLVKHIVEDADTPAGRAFDLAIQGLIALSLLSFTLDTLPGLSPAAYQALRMIEIVTVLVFTVEYLLRLWVADNRTGFVFSIYGLIDLVSILPFYLALGLDLRALRILRLFRLFRIFKLFRYTNAIRRFRKALASVKEELVLYLVATLFLVYLSSVGIYYFENPAQPEAFASVLHSMWWSFATLTTVGYGDVYPVTTGGRIFTALFMIIGIGVVAVPSGLLASALMKITKTDGDTQP